MKISHNSCICARGESVCKYALIFRGRVGNKDGKTGIRLQIESGSDGCLSAAVNNDYLGVKRH